MIITRAAAGRWGASMPSIEVEAERRLVIALDLPDPDRAYDVWQRLELSHAVCKIGLELLFSGGLKLVRDLSSAGTPVFVDAKLLDIGNTVERATARIADLGAAFLTVHSQDQRTVAAAVRGREDSTMKLLGITLLTNAASGDLSGQGISLTMADLVLHRAALAAEAGFEGVVSSPLEAKTIKARFGCTLSVICPGIRPAMLQAIVKDDQARTATPRDAIFAGADLLVVGRPVLGAANPAEAARSVITEIAAALQDLQSAMHTAEEKR